MKGFGSWSMEALRLLEKPSLPPEEYNGCALIKNDVSPGCVLMFLLFLLGAYYFR